MFIYDNYDVPPLVFIYVVKKKNRPIIAHSIITHSMHLSSALRGVSDII